MSRRCFASIARMILDLHKNPEYLGFLRMVVADSRQFPWIAKEFAAVMDPQTERLARYLAHLTDDGHPRLPQSAAGGSPVHGDAQRVFSVALDDRSRESLGIPDEDVVEETVRMFLQHYGRPHSGRH